MLFRRFLLTVTPMCLLTGTPANADTSLVPEYAGAEAGLIGIECVPEGDTIGYRFRGVLLDTASPNSPHDVILTTAHGFPATAERVTEECTVGGAKQRRYPIRAIWRSPMRDRGAVDDWAVVVTGKSIRGRIWRQRAFSESPVGTQELAAVETPVRLPLRFLGAERACALRSPGSGHTELEDGVFGHTCASWSGHSGSPILIADDEGVFVLGIHLGRRWMPETKESFRIGRFIDAEILDAIKLAAAWQEKDAR